MSASLYLIRHGQASFMQENYDRLSAVGHQQAFLLGQYFYQEHYRFDYCWRGALERHRDTYLGVDRVYHDHKMAFPKAEVLEGLNEHQAAEIHYHHLPEVLAQPENTEIKALMDEKGTKHPAVKKELLKLFFQGTRQWARGELNLEGFETFLEFKVRVSRAYEYLLEHMEGKKQAIAFTSGGTIAMLLGLMLGLSDEKVIELNWQIRNGSITELSYSKHKFYLRGFNYISHFEDKSIITYT